MAGLNLTGTAGVSGYGSAGVAAALPASYAASAAGATISSRAYGVGSDSGNGGPRTAAWGSTSAGLIGIALIVYLWWSLPR
jgi:hypothetical protein